MLEDAEKRVHSVVLDAGEYVGHGDLLTFQQFYVAKRLCQGSVTAIERLEFVRYFREAIKSDNRLNFNFKDFISFLYY